MRDRLRSDLEQILREAIAAADPAPLVRAALAQHPLPERVHVLAIGKAALPMLDAATQALQGRTIAALAVAPDLAAAPPRWTPPKPRLLRADHPVPGRGSLEAGHAVLSFLQPLGRDDCLLVLLSGGASALVTVPAPGLTLQDLAQTTRLLLAAGADIHALNCVRKHLDLVKGGRLARAAAPARVLCLALSDVIGDDPAVIGSGPFTADPSTFADAREVLVRFGAWEAVPAAVRDCIEVAEHESLEPGDPALASVTWQVIGSNATALEAAAAAAARRGYQVSVDAAPLRGEASTAGARIAARLRQSPRGYALILGGETTVTVRGGGSGGRNQELALAAALELDGVADCALGAAGTDGVDGNSPAAGAVVDHTTVRRMRKLSIDAGRALSLNDSYVALAAVGDALITGPTGTNVMDVVVALRGGSGSTGES